MSHPPTASGKACRLSHSVLLVGLWITALGSLSIAPPLGAQDPALSKTSRLWEQLAGPHVVVADGLSYLGYVTKGGDVGVAVIDADGRRQQYVLAPGFDATRSADVVFAPRPDGRVLAFYTHDGSDAISARVATRTVDGVSWSPALELRPAQPISSEDRADLLDRGLPVPVVTFSDLNPVLLGEVGTGVLVWRHGLEGRAFISFSADLGETWTTGRLLFLPDRGTRGGRGAGVRIVGDGRRRVHFLVTDSDPARVRTNSIYHFFYEDGAFYRLDGTRIGDPESLPVRFDTVDVVYDGIAQGTPGDVWDIALSADGSPVIAYARDADGEPQYRYATWNGFRWIDRRVPSTAPITYPSSQAFEEQRTLSGIAVDRVDPRIVYLSSAIDGAHRIQRLFMPDAGATWSTQTLTRALAGDALRPAVAPGDASQTTLAWLTVPNGAGEDGFALHASRIPRTPYSADLDPDEVLRVMRGVADWQLRNPVTGGPWGFPSGTLYAGLLALSRFPDGEAYEAAALRSSESNGWNFGDGGDPSRRYEPLSHTHGQVYLELYLQHRRPDMLHESKALGDEMLRMPFEGSLEWGPRIQLRGWGFEDALFMTPTLLARLATATRDRRYLELMDRLWWKTTDYLFDTEQRLFIRDSRYFDTPLWARYWSRGNGWVMAAMARVLPHLPSDFESRPRYEDLFRTMASRIAGLQQEDGYWRPALLVPDHFPMRETSGTGMFVFALAWGINAGLLREEEYLPVVSRGWAALVNAVDVNGKLGWSQPPNLQAGAAFPGRSDSYSVGAFLLAGTEIHRLTSRRDEARPR